MRLILWGTYDTGKPRNRLLRAALAQGNATEVIEIHRHVWGDVEDKSQLSGLGSKFRRGLVWLAAYPGLVWRYLRAPDHDAVVVGYLGQLDVLVLWPFAKLRGKPVVWDAFLSLYDTMIRDRAQGREGGLLARLVFAWEWLACRAADRVVLDTAAHADLFRRLYHLPDERLAHVLVGAETAKFPVLPLNPPKPDGRLRVLFYGQFTPLHGIDTIVGAAQRAGDRPIDWVLIGKGQESGRIEAMLKAQPVPSLRWIDWVDYEALIDRIAEADICLGIFSQGDKAANVIPNKVFQILSAGRPLVTRDSPAIRELLSPDMPGVYLVPPADPDALLDALDRFADDRAALASQHGDGRLHSDLRARFSLDSLASEWHRVLRAAIEGVPV